MSIRKNSIRVLITGPHLDLQGGVANIYRSIKWHESEQVEYFSVGPGKNQYRLFYVPIMVVKFLAKAWNVQIVQINPSLDFKSVIRDGFLLLLSKLMKKSIIVFFHGWEEDFETILKRRLIWGKIFAWTYNRADAYCLLGSIFHKKLQSLGVSANRIFYLPTVADDSFYMNFRAGEESDVFKKEITILFLSRFDKNKGIDIVIKTFRYLQTLGSTRFRLLMAGDGPLLDSCKEVVETDKIANIYFEGFVEGQRKHQLLSEADILFLPSLSEGLPCVIMEGMLYGLAIVSRPIGGIPDWVKQNENGWLSSSTDPEIFARGILSLVDQPQLLLSIKKMNTDVALAHFTPAKVKQQMQNIHGYFLN